MHSSPFICSHPGLFFTHAGRTVWADKVNWTGELTWPKNKLLAVYLFGFADLFLAWISPPVLFAVQQTVVLTCG